MAIKRRSYLVSGIEVKIDPRVLGDVTIFRRLRTLMGNGYKGLEGDFALHDLFDEILGKEQAEDVVGKLADGDGFLPSSKFGEFVTEMLFSAVPKN